MIHYIEGIENTLADHLSRPETLKENKAPVRQQLRPDDLNAEETNTSDESDVYHVKTINKLTTNEYSAVIDLFLKIHNSEEFNHPGILNTKIKAEIFLNVK
jgi:hypothetical protein